MTRDQITKKEKELIGLIAGQNEKINNAHRKIEEANLKIKELNLALDELRSVHKDTHKYCGKILYGSQSEADRARNLINRDLKKVGKDPIRRSYFCKDCEAWHVTTIAQWTKPILEEEFNG